MGNSWFKKKHVYKYTWFRMAEGRVVDRALVDYMLLPKRMLGRLLDVRVRRGGSHHFHYFLVEVRLKLVGGWRSAGRLEGVRNVLTVSEMNNRIKERAYQETFGGKYEVWRGGEVESVEEEWEKFRDMVMKCTNYVSGMRRVGVNKSNGNEWWNEKVDWAVAEKRGAVEE